MYANDALIWLIIAPMLASPLAYFSGKLVQRKINTGKRNWTEYIPGVLTTLILISDLIPLSICAQTLLDKGVVSVTFGQITFHLDGIGFLLTTVVLALGSIVSLYSLRYMREEVGEEKYYALLTAMIGSIIGLGCTSDLFNLWVWFEAMAITTVMLVAFYRQQPAALESGVKYLVQSATGSVLVLIAISLVYTQVGSLSLDVIRDSVQSPSLLLITAGALFFIGFGVKIALVPLHTWLPDAHSQAPSGISAMLSGIVIEAGLVALLRALGSLFFTGNQWGYILLGFGALNMLVGNLMALRQIEVKRMLAYSSLAHVGYMLLGLGTAAAFGQFNGAAGGFFHLANHALMKGSAFLAAGALLYTLHLAKGDHAPLVVDDLAGAAKRYPVVAFALSVAVLGLGGLPPLAGFMSKWQIFVAGFETKNAVVIVLVIFAALNSVLSLAYYAPLVNRMYREKPSHLVETGKPASLLFTFPLILMTIITVIIGFYPTLLNWLTYPAASSLMALFGA